jgi:hypothetical protein
MPIPRSPLTKPNRAEPIPAKPVVTESANANPAAREPAPAGSAATRPTPSKPTAPEPAPANLGPTGPALARSAFARLAVALLVSAGCAGCTAEDQSTPPPSAPAPASAPPGGVATGCADAVAQEKDPGQGYRVVADVVAVPVGDRVLEPAEHAAGEGPTRLFAKWGLLVRTGATVELSLLPGWGDRARIGWGGSGSDPATSVTVVSCPAEPGRAPWSVFTGGTWVIEPDCVPIRVSAQPAGQQVTVELSIGTSCRRPGG